LDKKIISENKKYFFFVWIGLKIQKLEKAYVCEKQFSRTCTQKASNICRWRSVNLTFFGSSKTPLFWRNFNHERIKNELKRSALNRVSNLQITWIGLITEFWLSAKARGSLLTGAITDGLLIEYFSKKTHFLFNFVKILHIFYLSLKHEQEISVIEGM